MYSFYKKKKRKEKNLFKETRYIFNHFRCKYKNHKSKLMKRKKQKNTQKFLHLINSDKRNAK